MRVLDKSSLRLGLSDLGFLSDDQATFERLITLPDGIVLVTGPTGSGKTTTLYACLNFINRPTARSSPSRTRSNTSSPASTRSWSRKTSA
jgi:type II secretory ATPase GspE/PulE/Tfp pilus assembly ATPase PilB-like protein